jgi:hypothetical protein
LGLPQQEIETLVSDLEGRVDRLRVLYEQYFLGFEKLEPAVPRKECERRLDILRKENIRNTGLRFRFQRVLQRYNTYQTYWIRICRQIEEGTFKRHVQKAKQRFGDDARREDIPSVEVNLDDLEAEMAALGADGLLDDDDDEDTIRPPPPPAQAPESRRDLLDLDDPAASSAEFHRVTFDRNAVALAPPAVPGVPTAHRGTSAVLPQGAKPKVIVRKAGAPTPGAQPAAPPATGAASSAQQRVAAPAAPSGAQRAAAPVAPPSGAQRAAAPVAPPSGAQRAAQPAAPSGSQRVVAAASSGAQRAAQPAPSAPRMAAAPAKAGDLSDERIKQLYSKYIEAKRANKESTASVTYDSLARSLRESSQKLKEKHAGKQVDFEVTVKDGKTILRPVVK